MTLHKYKTSCNVLKCEKRGPIFCSGREANSLQIARKALVRNVGSLQCETAILQTGPNWEYQFLYCRHWYPHVLYLVLHLMDDVLVSFVRREARRWSWKISKRASTESVSHPFSVIFKNDGLWDRPTPRSSSPSMRGKTDVFSSSIEFWREMGLQFLLGVYISPVSNRQGWILKLGNAFCSAMECVEMNCFWIRTSSCTPARLYHMTILKALISWQTGLAACGRSSRKV